MDVTKEDNPAAGMVKREVLAALQGIQCDLERNPDSLGSGICHLVYCRIDCNNVWFTYHVSPILAELFRRWPGFSGSGAYPVPHFGDLMAQHAFHTFNKWTKHSAYGRARRSLLAFMITELSKEIGE